MVMGLIADAIAIPNPHDPAESMPAEVLRWLRPPGRDVKAAPLIEAEATDQVSKA